MHYELLPIFSVASLNIRNFDNQIVLENNHQRIQSCLWFWAWNDYSCYACEFMIVLEPTGFYSMKLLVLVINQSISIFILFSVLSRWDVVPCDSNQQQYCQICYTQEMGICMGLPIYVMPNTELNVNIWSFNVNHGQVFQILS